MSGKRAIGRRHVAAALVASMAVLVLVLATTAPASAERGERLERLRARPETGAIAIGELQAAGGGSAWLSLRAGGTGGEARGNFRYYCPAAGYYNGAVRALTVTDGAIHAEGGGALTRPDGTRMRVRFTLDVAADGSAVSVAITGDEYEYDMAGSLDGFVFGGAPGALVTAR